MRDGERWVAILLLILILLLISVEGLRFLKDMGEKISDTIEGHAGLTSMSAITYPG